MHLLVIDPGYAHQNSHHHQVNGELARFLGPRGWTIQVAASANIDTMTRQYSEAENVTTSPHFETACYQDDIDTLDPETHNQLSAHFSDELVAVMRCLPKDATILLHTGFSAHFKGLADALARCGRGVNWTVIVLGMFPPYGERNSGQTIGIAPLRYRHALTSLQHLSRARSFRFCFAVPCRLYQRLYAPLCGGHTPPIHPAVNYRPYQPVTQEPKRQRILAFLGCPKADKGIEFAAQFSVELVAKEPAIEVIFQFNHEFSEAAAHTKVAELLRKTKAQHPNLRLIEGRLSDLEYDQLLGSISIVCLFHDPGVYGQKTSGLLWDALRIPTARFLTSSGTWAEQELIDLGIPSESVPFGNIPTAIRQASALLSNQGIPRPSVKESEYLDCLMQPLGSWLNTISEPDPSYT